MKQETERGDIYVEERQGTWNTTVDFSATIDTTASTKFINSKEKGKEREVKGKRGGV